MSKVMISEMGLVARRALRNKRVRICDPLGKHSFFHYDWSCGDGDCSPELG